MTAPAPTSDPSPGYFFVSGAHKSGTTWIMRLLNAHPEVGVVGEAGFVGFEWGVDSWFQEEAFRKWGEATMRKKLWMGDTPVEEAARAMKRGMIEALMKLRHGKPGVRRFGDKTPHFYNRHADDLHDLFPDAWIVDVVRDGRDVCVSHMFHMLRMGYGHGEGEEADRARAHHLHGEGDPVPLFVGEALQVLIKKWKVAVEGGDRLRELFGERFLQVRYEDLLEDAAGGLVRMLEHLGVSADSATVLHCVERHTFEKASKGRARGDLDPTSFFRKGVAGDWRNHFGEAERALFQKRAGHLLVALGYEADESWTKA